MLAETQHLPGGVRIFRIAKRGLLTALDSKTAARIQVSIPVKYHVFPPSLFGHWRRLSVAISAYPCCATSIAQTPTPKPGTSKNKNTITTYSPAKPWLLNTRQQQPNARLQTVTPTRREALGSQLRAAGPTSASCSASSTLG